MWNKCAYLPICYCTRGLEEISQQFFGALGARMVPKPRIFADYFTYFTVVKNHVTMSFMSPKNRQNQSQGGTSL